jgi:hypothetical protein
LETNHRGCRSRMPALSRKRSSKLSFIRFPVVRLRILQVIRSKLVSWWNEAQPPTQSALEPIPMRQRGDTTWSRPAIGDSTHARLRQWRCRLAQPSKRRLYSMTRSESRSLPGHRHRQYHEHSKWSRLYQPCADWRSVP